MTPLIISLVLPLGLLALLALQAILNQRMQVKWMRIFCEHSLKISPSTIEDRAALEEALPKLPEAPRKRISVPIPGSSLFKRPPSAH